MHMQPLYRHKFRHWDTGNLRIHQFRCCRSVPSTQRHSCRWIRVPVPPRIDRRYDIYFRFLSSSNDTFEMFVECKYLIILITCIAYGNIQLTMKACIPKWTITNIPVVPIVTGAAILTRIRQTFVQIFLAIYTLMREGRKVGGWEGRGGNVRQSANDRTRFVATKNY